MEILCEEHGLPKENLCSWCGKAVCEECITQAYGKSYCFSCLAKLPLDTLGSINDSIASRGTKNIDPNLSQKDAEEGRKYIQMKMSSDEEMVQGLRNVDERTKHKEEQLRKDLEEYQNMKKKFNL